MGSYTTGFERSESMAVDIDAIVGLMEVSRVR